MTASFDVQGMAMSSRKMRQVIRIPRRVTPNGAIGATLEWNSKVRAQGTKEFGAVGGALANPAEAVNEMGELFSVFDSTAKC